MLLDCCIFVKRLVDIANIHNESRPHPDHQELSLCTDHHLRIHRRSPVSLEVFQMHHCFQWSRAWCHQYPWPVGPVLLGRPSQGAGPSISAAVGPENIATFYSLCMWHAVFKDFSLNRMMKNSRGHVFRTCPNWNAYSIAVMQSKSDIPSG